MTRRRPRFRSFRGGATTLAIIVGTAIGVPIIVTQIPGGGPPPGSCATVSQYTVTFTFSKALPCGQFANGDWWVTPAAGDSAATITAMTPGYTSSPGRNGYMINPTSLTSGNFDDRLSGYSAGTIPALPIAVSPDSSVIKAISTTGTCCVSPTHIPALQDVSVLTVLASVPALNGATTFRPAYFGTTKRLFTTAQLQTGLLPSVAPVAGAPTLAQVAARYQHAQLDTIQSFLGRYEHPSNGFFAYSNPATTHAYGALIGQDNTDAVLRLEFNDSVASKMAALVNVVQAGIDWYGLRKAGMCWSADGGHFQGRKIAIAFAGVLLGDSDMQDAVSSAVAGGCYAEDGHSYFSSTAGVSGRTYFVGATPGMALFGKACTTGTYQSNQNAGGTTGAKDCRDPGGYIDGGDIPGGDYMQDVAVGGSYIGQSVAVRLMPSLRTVWNNETFIELEDRWVDFGTWASPDPSAPRVCQKNFPPPASGATGPTGLAAVPSASGGTLGTANLFYKVTAIVGGVETLPSAEVATASTGPTGSVALSWAAVGSATAYRIYRGYTTGTESIMATPAGTGTSYTNTDTNPPTLYCAATGAPGTPTLTPPTPADYIGLHGTTTGGTFGGYASAFEANMLTAYRATIGDTFCGTGGCGGSGGSGLASGLTSLTDTTLPLETAAKVPTGAYATAYYQIYKPASLTGSGPWPAIIYNVGSAGGSCLGAGIPVGYSLTMANCVLASLSATNGNGMQAAADANGFILIAPFVDWKDTTSSSHPYGGNYGNDGCPGSVCGTTDYFNPQQLDLDALTYAESHANVDLTKIYMAGDSGGGNFTEAVVCQSPSWSTPGGTYHRNDPVPALLNQIAGVGIWSGSLSSIATSTVPQSGGTGSPLCNPTLSTHPLSIFRTMGTTDSIEGYDNSHLACQSRTVGSFCYIGFANETTYQIPQWGCSATPTSGPTVDSGLSGTATVTTTTYATGCYGGRAIQTVVSSGSGHDGLIWKLGCTPAATTCTFNVPNRMFAFLSTH